MKKQFKAESKKILDMMINSIYTNKEIFLRELISNASDAIDKLYYRSLTDKDVKINKEDLAIWINLDKEDRSIMISDNGCGMSKVELEENLGTIAKSGSELFKEKNDIQKDISIIGQFGVGFYSAFMVAKKVVVKSKTVDSDEAYLWESDGMDGYTINKCDKATVGTEIILYLKDQEDDEELDLLSEDKIRSIIKKYSDYIRYPIKMMVKHDDHEDEEVINSMVPIWKKKKNEVTDKEYNDFYSDKFYDYQEPLRVIRSDVEGLTSYSTLLFIPSHAPYNYYTKEYEKGLELYSRGVLIMDKCSDLLSDYFSFVKGIVDSEDIQLNISRETMQQNNQVKLISKNIEKKIKSELVEMLKNERENYEKFYQAFGMQLKHGIYASYGLNKEMLQDLLLFYSSKDEKYVTLDEYVARMGEDKKEIYYASGESINNIKMIPQVELMNEKEEILYLTEYLDEFVIKTIGEYQGKKFVNVTNNNLDNLSDEEKEKIEKINTDNKEILDVMKECLKDQVKDIKFTNSLKNHPVCLTTDGEVSLEMEKILNQMGQDSESIKAETILEINNNHPVSRKIRELHEEKKEEELTKYTKILYNSARMVAGLPVENPSELTDLICEIMGK